jgi:hypothetical protein
MSTFAGKAIGSFDKKCITRHSMFGCILFYIGHILISPAGES